MNNLIFLIFWRRRSGVYHSGCGFTEEGDRRRLWFIPDFVRLNFSDFKDSFFSFPVAEIYTGQFNDQNPN
ncbi:hypothetical protein U1Q18_010529, partial [Sarracenia purpurea var. burkii]